MTIAPKEQAAALLPGMFVDGAICLGYLALTGRSKEFNRITDEVISMGRGLVSAGRQDVLLSLLLHEHPWVRYAACVAAIKEDLGQDASAQRHIVDTLAALSASTSLAGSFAQIALSDVSGGTGTAKH